jgi:hypothetical protein
MHQVSKITISILLVFIFSLVRAVEWVRVCVGPTRAPRSPAHDAEEEIIQKRKHKVRPAILRSVPPLCGSSLIKIRAINVPIF